MTLLQTGGLVGDQLGRSTTALLSSSAAIASSSSSSTSVSSSFIFSFLPEFFDWQLFAPSSISLKLDMVHGSECIGLCLLIVVAYGQFRIKLAKHQLEEQQHHQKQHHQHHQSQLPLHSHHKDRQSLPWCLWYFNNFDVFLLEEFVFLKGQGGKIRSRSSFLSLKCKKILFACLSLIHVCSFTALSAFVFDWLSFFIRIF